MTLRAATSVGQAANTAPGTTTAGTSDGVTYTLQSYAYGGNSHVSSLAGQTTVGVGQAAKAIFTTPADGASLTVCGSDGTNKFSDMIIGGLTDAPMTAVTHTAAGSPAARTYSNAGAGAIQLVMASGTYNVNAFGLVAGQR